MCADHGDGSNDNRDLTLLTPNFFAVHTLEGVQVEGQERELLKLIQRETRNGELEDAVSKAAKALKSTSAKSICSSEWSEIDGILYFWGKIYVPPTSEHAFWETCLSIICISQSRQPDSQTPWKVENTGISEPELLVATDVKVYQPVHVHV